MCYSVYIREKGMYREATQSIRVLLCMCVVSTAALNNDNNFLLQTLLCAKLTQQAFTYLSIFPTPDQQILD